MTESKNDSNSPYYLGHRARIKDKFFNSSSSSKDFTDYELLELLLFFAIPRKDVKPLAKELLKIFKNFDQLLLLDREKFLSIKGTNRNAYILLKSIREIIDHCLYTKIEKQNIISSWSALLEYLQFNMGSLKIEEFRLLFLNKKNILIADEVMATGTIDQTAVYPREVVKRCLFYEAGAIILVHNHPTGNSKPSNADIELTSHIVQACKTINVSVHDHVIIGHNSYYSFKANMLL